MFDSLYSTGQRDQFRTRLERNAKGGTNIYITHKGMEEVYTNNRKDSTIWQPRPRDPELEAEFLRRLMVKLGISQEQAKAQVAQAEQSQARPAAARVVQLAGQSAVQIDDDFDRAWRRVGLALDRTGFSVEDRNRTQGTYFVRYVDPTLQKKEPGFFGKLFGRGTPQLPTSRYQVKVSTQGQTSTVTVLDGNGNPTADADAQRIVKVLADELK